MSMKEFYVGVKGVIRREDKVLLLHGSGERNFWDVPGGRIDDDEAILDTLQRELAEELLSLKAYDIGRLLDVQRVHRDITGRTSLVLVFYEIINPIFAGDIDLSDEHDYYAWVDIADVVNDESVSDAVRKMLKIIT